MTNRVQVIEDDATLQTAMSTALTNKGYEVVVSSDGEEGLAQALAEQPDVIVLDLLMPKKDGYQALEELRKDAWGKTVPVLVVSNVASPESINRILEAGATEYVGKADVQIAQLVEMVSKHLGNR